MRRIAILVIGAVIVYAISQSEYFAQYSAEVGYYEGSTQRWYIGNPTSREECTNEAIGMYNRLNHEKPGRAFSWVCLLTRDGRYISRHR